MGKLTNSLCLYKDLTQVVFGDASSRQKFLDNVAGNWNVSPVLKPEFKEEAKAEEKVEEKAEEKKEEKIEEKAEEKVEEKVEEKAEEKKEEVADEGIKIGNKEYTNEEFTSVLKKAGEHYGEDLTDLPDNLLMKVVTDYVNINEGSKSLANRNQKVKRDGEEIKAEKEKIELERTDIQKQLDEIAEEKKKIEQDKEDLKKKIEFNNELLKKDPDEVDDSREKRELEVDQALARKENPALEEKLKKVDLDIAKVDDRFVTNYISGLIETLQADNPELDTKDHVFDILSDMKSGKLKPEDPECFKATIITEILNEYNRNINKDGKESFSISQYYKTIKPKYSHALEKAQTSFKSNKTYTEFKADNAKEVIRKLLKKQKATVETNGRGSDSSKGEVEIPNSREAIAKRIHDHYKS